MMELVEMSIGNEMKTMRGAVMYDGWTNNGSHYLSVFSVMMKQVNKFVGRKDVDTE